MTKTPTASRKQTSSGDSSLGWIGIALVLVKPNKKRLELFSSRRLAALPQNCHETVLILRVKHFSVNSTFVTKE